MLPAYTCFPHVWIPVEARVDVVSLGNGVVSHLTGAGTRTCVFEKSIHCYKHKTISHSVFKSRLFYSVHTYTQTCTHSDTHTHTDPLQWTLTTHLTAHSLLLATWTSSNNLLPLLKFHRVSGIPSLQEWLNVMVCFLFTVLRIEVRAFGVRVKHSITMLHYIHACMHTFIRLWMLVMVWGVAFQFYEPYVCVCLHGMHRAHRKVSVSPLFSRAQSCSTSFVVTRKARETISFLFLPERMLSHACSCWIFRAELLGTLLRPVHWDAGLDRRCQGLAEARWFKQQTTSESQRNALPQCHRMEPFSVG